MPILSICNPETLQNLPKLILKMLNLGGKLLEYTVFGWAEFQWVYIIVTQIGHKFVIGSWPPKNGKIAQNSMTYKFQITYDRKLKFSGFISVTERFISAKFQQNLNDPPVLSLSYFQFLHHISKLVISSWQNSQMFFISNKSCYNTTCIFSHFS